MTRMRDFRFGPSGKSGTAFTFSCAMRTLCSLNHWPSFGARNRKETVMRTKRLALGVVLVIGSSVAAVDAALAVEYRGTAEQQMACTPDVWRLCSSQIPDVSRIVACLRANRPYLSEGCRAVFAGGPLPEPVPQDRYAPPPQRAPAPQPYYDRAPPPYYNRGPQPYNYPAPRPYDDDDDDQ
jgi:hypothetical protein